MQRRANVDIETTGWRPGCGHGTPEDNEKCFDFLKPVPCTVLDPFAGSGTTLKVARDLGRHAIGIELNPEYCDLAVKRINAEPDQPQRDEHPDQVPLW